MQRRIHHGVRRQRTGPRAAGRRWSRQVGRGIVAAALAAILVIAGGTGDAATAATASSAAGESADGATHGTYAFPGNDGRSHTVDFDKHSFTVDGEPLNIWSGEFHYWRIPSPDHWRDLLQKMKAAGYNAVSLYFFWGLHQSEKGGDFDFSGIRDIDRLLTMAEQEGLYVIARPGPYINAEISMGGLPAYMTNQSAELRQLDEDGESAEVLDDSVAWLNAIDEIIGKHQVTDGGGSVLMYQVENELLDESAPRLRFLKALTQAVKDDGITVPLFHNDYGMGGRYADTDATGLDFYAYDNYPLGFNCSAERGRIGESEESFRRFAPDSPQFITESQGGAFTPWGADYTADECYDYTDPSFTRQWGVRNIGNGVTAYNSYMAFGGTNWGWTGSPSSGFTSYDYGSALDEDRTITEKFAVDKEIGYYQKAVPDLTRMDPTGGVDTDVVSGSSVTSYQRVATGEDAAGATDDGSTRFLGFRLSDSNDEQETSFTFPLVLGEDGGSGNGDTTVDDRSDELTYTGTWEETDDSSAYDGTVTSSDEKGARVSFGFSGTSISVVTPTGTDHGTATVYIDGEKHGTFTSHVDTDQNKPAQQVSYEADDLEPGAHTIEIEVAGEPADGGDGTTVALDGFVLPGEGPTEWNDDSDHIDYTGDWEHASGEGWTAGDIGGDETFSDTAGDSYEFSFTGAGFELVGPYSENHGPADVYVDGEKVGATEEQTTSQATPKQVLFAKRDLEKGEHHVKVVVTGDSFDGSSGAFHSLDAVRIYADADDGSAVPDGAIGWESVPQKKGTALTLHGRDALMVTADTRIGGNDLYYTTSQLFGQALPRHGGTLQYAIGHGGDPGETVLHYDERPDVDAPDGVEQTWDDETGQLRLNYTHGDPQNITVDDGEHPLTLRIMDRDHAERVWFEEGAASGSDGAGSATAQDAQPQADAASDANRTVVVEGAYVPRTVDFDGDEAALTGSMDEAGTLRFDVPDGIRTVTWNGDEAAVSDGTATLEAPGPETVDTPDLDWVSAEDDAESQVDFDDSDWTSADDTEGSTGFQGPGEGQGVVLDSNHYGFYEGAVWYRAHYTADRDDGTITLQGNGGTGQPAQGKEPAFMQVWVNGEYAGAPKADGADHDVEIPDGAADEDEDVVVSVLVHNLGQNLDWSDNGLSKQNRGLYDAELTDDGDVAWKIRGASAEDADPTRTLYNSGGLGGDLDGWHLPDADDSSWSDADDLVAEDPGVRWYRASATLDVPEGQDTAFHLTVHSSAFDDGRSDRSQAVLYVNGWNTGVYIGDIGPQNEFTVPSGFLNMRGENEIAVAVSAKEAGMGPEDITLDAVHSTTGDVAVADPGDDSGGDGPGDGDGSDDGNDSGDGGDSGSGDSGSGPGAGDGGHDAGSQGPGGASDSADGPGAQPSGPGELPWTGASVAALVAAGVLAVAAGGAITVAELIRRRRAVRD